MLVNRISIEWDVLWNQPPKISERRDWKWLVSRRTRREDKRRSD